MKSNDPESWEDACMVDEAVREGVRGTSQQLYIHRTLTPLRDADLADPAEGQATFSFMDECDGMCGV